MRMIAVVSAIVSMHIAVADVVITPDGSGWSVRTPVYSAKVGSTGYVTSIAHAGNEFLAQKGKTPGGFYLCMGKVPSLADLECAGSTVSGRNELGTLAWEFGETAIRCKVTCHNEKGVAFYGILDPAVAEVLVTRGDLRVTPASASSGRFLWFRGDSVLEMVGGNRIWGPWQEHQVWDARLKDGEMRMVEIIPRAKTAGDVAKSAPAPTIVFDVSGRHSTPAQVPLCMIGDSITWWGHGDTWRQYLLERIPTLAFVGTHTARLGYSHAGEGGNSIERVTGRIDDIPDCPYYALLIGTNNNSVKVAEDIQPRAAKAAAGIEKLVGLLLAKSSVKTVFLGSILPCHTDNPLRDQTNSATNVLLRQRLGGESFPEEKVVWVEYEKPIRALDGWEPMIKLHPEPEGYEVLAEILAERIRTTLGLPEKLSQPVPVPGAGVRVWNLWDDVLKETSVPLIAGYYTLSFDVVNVTGDSAGVMVRTADAAVTKGAFSHRIPVKAAQVGTRTDASFYTREEGYHYTRAIVTVRSEGCEVSNIQIEKMRPSKKPSAFGHGIHIDTDTTPNPGELIEKTQ